LTTDEAEGSKNNSFSRGSSSFARVLLFVSQAGSNEWSVSHDLALEQLSCYTISEADFSE
jgi:hypothetical protein